MSDATPPEGGTPPATPPDGGTPPANPPATPPGDGGTPPANYFQSMPEDTNWRGDLVSLAGYEGEEATKRAGQLERVLDMGTLTKRYFDSQDKIRKGELSNGLPENPTEEQLSEWRGANGVPATADAYEMSLEDGLILGEEDLRIMDVIYPIAHELNVPTSTMSALTNAMLKGREIEAEAMQQQDGMHTQQTVQQLKSAWGQDFETNKNMVQGLVAQLPETVRESFENARLADGRAVFNSPEMMVFFADTARKLNPAGTVVPNANNPTQAISDEIAKLEGRMGDEDWFKDTEAQNRLQELYRAREAMKK